MNDSPIDLTTERMLRSLSDHLTSPRPRECLPCFVARMLQQFGCDNQLRFARRYRDLAAPRATALDERLQRLGGFCDCEIFLNGYRLTVPSGTDGKKIEAPPCCGVRRGSTQPCVWWEPA